MYRKVYDESYMLNNTNIYESTYESSFIIHNNISFIKNLNFLKKYFSSSSSSSSYNKRDEAKLQRIKKKGKFNNFLRFPYAEVNDIHPFF